MSPIETLKEQNEFAQQMTSIYNEVAASVGTSVSQGQLDGWKIRMAELAQKFEANDRSLRPPSYTILKNLYFKDDIPKTVRDMVSSFEPLINSIKVIRGNEGNGDETMNEAPIQGVEELSEFDILSRKFSFALREFEENITGVENNDICISDVVHIKNLTEGVWLQYSALVGDNDLTRTYAELKIRYLKLSKLTKEKKVDKPIPGLNQYYKIPTIDLPIFSGDYSKWNSFKELFDQIIEKTDLSTVHKMCVLKSKLRGDALSSIENLTTSDVNYPIALKILNDRYSNKRAMANIFFKNLVDAPLAVDTANSVKKFRNLIQESHQALASLNLTPEKLMDSIINFILVRKLDGSLRKRYETSLGSSKDIPRIRTLLEFLDHEFFALEASQEPSENVTSATTEAKKKSKMSSFEKCLMDCSSLHFTNHCSKFKNLSVSDRWKRVLSGEVCSNCLRAGHTSYECKMYGCKTCNKKHHILLHRDTQQEKPQIKIKKEFTKSAVVRNTKVEKYTNQEGCVVLGTAVVQISNGKGGWVNCRALLDTGSQVNLITKSMQAKLKLKGEKTNISIEGISQNMSKVNERLNIHVKSKVSDFNTHIEVLVVPRTVSNLPSKRLDTGKIPKNIKLADPQWNIPSKIDMIIGINLFYEISIGGSISQEDGSRVKYQNTNLGWVATGTALYESNPLCCGVVSMTDNSLDYQLKKFWEIEEIEEIKMQTKEEMLCEQNFLKSVEKSQDGKFIVNLPLKDNVNSLGISEFCAKRRFFSIEKKLEKNEAIKTQYHDFMKKYYELNHMELVEDRKEISRGYYLPHHFVLRPESTSTKLRVVFDASCKTTSNLSLNDVMFTGPRLQDDLFEILMRFRKHRYVFSGDIEKMYRQIWVNEAHRKYQLILWRWDSSQPLETYRLNTVTYGTSSAPYLAVKCLQEAGKAAKEEFPQAADAILSDFYMDDVMTGSDSLDELLVIQKQIHEILKKNGFPLRKWCANHVDLLKNFPKEDCEVQLDFSSENDEIVKALGISWNPLKDEIFIKSNWESATNLTKRSILSDIAKLFDPLGLLNPIIVTAKIIMQKLWKLKIDWDEKIPEEISSAWIRFRNEWSILNEIKLERHIVCVDPIRIELHGFSDASMKAYGAVVYIKSINAEGDVKVELIASKSRVAPVKIVQLPKLELCAAVLLMDLMKKSIKGLKQKFNAVYFYSDSQIVLSWLKLDPGLLQIFVSNRVNYIQVNSKIENWRYVNTKENPADLVSRGIYPKDIVNNRFWFKGPLFLLSNADNYKVIDTPIFEIPELKKKKLVSLVVTTSSMIDNINHKNDFKILQNVVGYVLKFIDISRKKATKSWIDYKKEALMVLFKHIQRKHFSEEIKTLKANKNLPGKSNIKTLSPLLDKDRILRVGGRIERSRLSYEAKHPILLPYSDKLVFLFLTFLHITHLHVGPQGLLAIVRQGFWPLRGKQLTKKVVHLCYRCFKANPRVIHQLLGSLPEDRVIRTRPFLNTGIDFLGPISIHHKIRGKRIDKSYVCVFVCFSTKAVHLEVVSDLTAAAFIGAFKRFVGRRSCPLKIYSDNGTNFIGAANSLHEIYQLFKNKNNLETIDKFCAQKDIEWINIPARSPHVGGLWEACVKSVKKHFYRVIEGTMTFEEMCTLMSQIEAVLNSRPLTPLSDDPNDFTVLTPGHFLIGESFSTFMDSTDNGSYHGLRDHWKSVQDNSEEFWRRWSLEYLSELQKRYKWQNPSDNIKEGTLVLLKEDNIPPMNWRRGRVIKTIIGYDGLCRMVDVRTSNGVTKRSIHNVCPFPTKEDYDKEQTEMYKQNLEITNNVKNKLIQSKNNNVNVNDKSSKNNNDKSSKNINDKRSERDNLLTDNDKNEKSKNIRKSKRLKNKNCLVNILSFLIIIPTLVSSVSSFSIEQLRDTSGIFFENQGFVGLQKSSWSLIAYVNMSTYWSRYAKVEQWSATIEQWSALGDASSSVNQWKEVMEPIRKKLVTIKNNHIFIVGNKKRIRRAPLAFIGAIQHAVFGTMDEEHADLLQSRVKTSENNQAYLLELMRNMSSIEDVTSNIIRKEHNHLEEQLKKIKLNFDQLAQEIYSNKKVSLGLLAVINIFAVMDDFTKFQQDIKDAIINNQFSQSRQDVISIQQLQDHLGKISTNLPKELQIPDQQAIEVLKVVQMSARVTDQYIIYEIKIPLIHKDIFTVYEVFAYPTLHDKRFVSIQPNFRHLLLSASKARYYNLNDIDFIKCKQMSTMWLCPQSHPIYNVGSEKVCELELLLKKKSLSKECILKIERPKSKWIQLHAPNTWLFSTLEEEVVDVYCATEKFVKHIKGQGILQLQSGCHLESTDVTLVAFSAVQEKVSYFNPILNLSFHLPALHPIILKEITTTVAIDDLPQPSATILGFPIEFDSHHLNHYGNSMVTWFVLIAIVIVIVYLWRQGCQMSSRFLPATFSIPRF